MLTAPIYLKTYVKIFTYLSLKQTNDQWFTGKCFDTGLQVNGGCSTVPQTTGCMTMKFLPDVNLHGEMQNLKKKLK